MPGKELRRDSRMGVGTMRITLVGGILIVVVIIAMFVLLRALHEKGTQKPGQNKSQ